MAKDRAALIKRVIGGAIVVGALAFAVQGGEFSTLDLLRQRRQIARVTRSVDSLQRVVDSLARYEDRVQHDPATQERIAREVFGMVRGSKEIVYRFADLPDSARRDSVRRDSLQ
jgi:cell division protein FtsB